MDLTLYHFDEFGVFTETTVVKPDVRFPSGYPEPSQSTRQALVDDSDQPLIAGENEALYFDGADWSIVPDFRGQTYWMPDRSSQTNVTLGPLPDGATLEEPPLSAAEQLAAERAQLNPFRMAFRTALHRINSPIPGVTMLVAVEALIADLRAIAPLDDVVRWYEDVQQVVRLHPDITVVQQTFAQAPSGFPLSDEMVDAICRVGVAIDKQMAPTEITQLVNDANGLWP